MKYSSLIISLILTIAAICGPVTLAKDAPTSAELLRDGIEAAAKAKNTEAFLAFFNWQGVSATMKAEVMRETSNAFIRPVSSVKLIPLPADTQLTNTVNGVCYRPNVTVIGMIEINYDVPGNNLRVPYGTTDGGYFLSSVIEERISAAPLKEKSLSLQVKGTTQGVEFTGSYVYVKNGKEIKGTINATGNWSEAFWGDHIKTCEAHVVSPNGQIKVVILENGKDFFISAWAGSVSYLPQ